ncbi:MAG TPA: MFS transporter [Methylomirabilota bacterium]|nr:MFS transporter [Methylomirabilota bacterium]
MLFALALLAFVSLGLPDGVLGVAWPSMRASFGLPLAQLGVLLAASMVGYLGSSFTSGWLVARLGVGRLLVWSSALIVANSAAYALAPRWSAMVAAAVLAGLGAGAIDAGINAFAAVRFPPRLLSWLHAAYGVGAMAGPLLMTAVLAGGHSWRLGYALLGLALAGMMVAFVRARPLWQARAPAASPGASTAPAPARRLTATLRRPAVWLNVALFFLYTGIEVTAGQWTYSLFTEGRGITPELAGLLAAGYWGALTMGRIGFGWLADRVPAPTLLRVAMMGAPVAALLLWRAPGAWGGGAGLLALGISLAPIYPLLVAATPERLGDADTANAIGFQVAAACLGAAVLPGAAGLLAHRGGLDVIGPFLLGAALLLLLLHALAARRPALALRRPVAARARA